MSLRDLFELLSLLLTRCQEVLQKFSEAVPEPVTRCQGPLGAMLNLSLHPQSA